MRNSPLEHRHILSIAVNSINSLPPSFSFFTHVQGLQLSVVRNDSTVAPAPYTPELYRLCIPLCVRFTVLESGDSVDVSLDDYYNDAGGIDSARICEDLPRLFYGLVVPSAEFMESDRDKRTLVSDICSGLMRIRRLCIETANMGIDEALQGRVGYAEKETATATH